MAGLGPAIHVFAADRSGRCECVDARHKAGHDELAGRCIIRMSQNTREVAGFAYRMLYIDPMLVRSALGVCAITPFVPYAVAEDPALAAVLAEAFETFPGARSACPPGSRRRAVGRAVAPLRSQDQQAASLRRQHCRKACACLSRHCDREFGDRTVERLDEGRKPTVAAPPMPLLTMWRGR
jgi:hypothetical protein